MNHPELIYKASYRCRIPVMLVIYDAFCYEERKISKSHLNDVYQLFIHTRQIPQFVEDYALDVLAGRAVRQPFPLLLTQGCCNAPHKQMFFLSMQFHSPITTTRTEVLFAHMPITFL